MPELPEVQTTVDFLREHLVGESILSVEIGWPRLINQPSLKDFCFQLSNSSITALSRRGKYIVITVTQNNKVSYLFAHMRMSGSFDVLSKDISRSKHDHVIMKLSSGKEVRFHDPRKFGRFDLVTSAEAITSKLGIEPLDDNLSWQVFAKTLRKKKSNIKNILLDQRIIAGVGNIYADESLWYAGIHPKRKIERLKDEQLKKLYSSLRKVLKKALLTKGTDNGDGVVEGGMYAPKAYGRAGLKCFRCKKVMKRTIVAQRGTTFCAACQK